MRIPTDQKRVNAAEALQTAIRQLIMYPQPTTRPHECADAIDAIVEYAIAEATDQLTAIAGAMIFKQAGPSQDVTQSGTPSEPG